MVFVFFWIALVIKNIVHVTVAGGVAAWKIKPDTPAITLRSWSRALTLSLGSICFGSLFVSIVETVKELKNVFASKSENEPPLKFFNRYGTLDESLLDCLTLLFELMIYIY